MTQIALSANQVSKHYGKFKALDGATLELFQGEILALLGPNGAGKTTLIKILATLLNKNSGVVNILGYDLDREQEAIRHLVGYVGQDTERSAYARLTTWENLSYFGMLRGMSITEIRQQVKLLADYFNFHAQMDKLFVTLSGGQKQTVVIMRALLHNPPVVYLDEPTKGLDPLVARRIRSFLKQYIHDQDKSMLLTSHVLSEVDEMADRVALIQGGKIPVTGTPQDLKAGLGAQDYIELEKTAVPEAVSQEILQLPSVLRSYERDPGWISFGVSDAMRGAEEIIRLLRESNIQASFRHHTATLEDAFFHHIGELTEKFEQ